MKDDAFTAGTLAADIDHVRAIYAGFFDQLTAADWRLPADGDEAWNLREVVAHLGALGELGQESIEAALHGQALTIPGFNSRFDLAHMNRQKIDERLHLPPETLSAGLLDALSRASDTAANLTARELACTVELPLYNRPVRVDELLGIQVMHAGIVHAAQVAEPAGLPPLWTRLAAGVRQRTISRVVRALSLLYRQDLGGDIEAVLVFRVGGAGGGTWHVLLSPENPGSAVGGAGDADLTLTFRDPAVFCRMFTGRLKLLGALLSGRLRPRGNLRLFLRFRSLFSVDATE